MCLPGERNVKTGSDSELNCQLCQKAASHFVQSSKAVLQAVSIYDSCDPSEACHSVLV